MNKNRENYDLGRDPNDVDLFLERKNKEEVWLREIRDRLEGIDDLETFKGVNRYTLNELVEKFYLEACEERDKEIEMLKEREVRLYSSISETSKAKNIKIEKRDKLLVKIFEFLNQFQGYGDSMDDGDLTTVEKLKKDYGELK